jgi:hypothetical protein
MRLVRAAAVTPADGRGWGNGWAFGPEDWPPSAAPKGQPFPQPRPKAWVSADHQRSPTAQRANRSPIAPERQMMIDWPLGR